MLQALPPPDPISMAFPPRQVIVNSLRWLCQTPGSPCTQATASLPAPQLLGREKQGVQECVREESHPPTPSGVSGSRLRRSEGRVGGGEKPSEQGAWPLISFPHSPRYKRRQAGGMSYSPPAGKPTRLHSDCEGETGGCASHGGAPEGKRAPGPRKLRAGSVAAQESLPPCSCFPPASSIYTRQTAVSPKTSATPPAPSPQRVSPQVPGSFRFSGNT